MTSTLQRPEAQESSEYFKTYINQVPGNDFLNTIIELQTSTTQLMESFTAEQWDHRYAPGKWTIKEVFLHIIDTEQVMAYRALRIARNDQTPLPGFDQDVLMEHINAEQRSAASILEAYNVMRSASIAQFKYLDDAALSRMGTASGSPISARALAYIIAGHEIHHLKVLKERYFSA